MNISLKSIESNEKGLISVSGKVKVKEEKDASSMAPGSPPTPPHTPQSPPRHNPPPGNLSQSCQTSNTNSPSLQQQQQQQQQQESHQQQQPQSLHAMANSPLSQILVQNPALAQLLQQNPAILSQNPQLAQLLQQNLQVQMGSVLFQNVRREEPEESRVSQSNKLIRRGSLSSPAARFHVSPSLLLSPSPRKWIVSARFLRRFTVSIGNPSATRFSFFRSLGEMIKIRYDFPVENAANENGST